MNAKLALALLIVVGLTSSASAAFLVQIDTDGADDGVLTYNSHFTFGGDTTTASQSAPASAFGLVEADSIFGGDGSASPDTYVYRYDPTVDVDNLVTTGVELGVDLGGSPVSGSGVAGGAAGDYRVYAAWPATSNVSGELTRYTVTSGVNSFFVDVDQNTANDPDGDDANDVWLYLGDISYDGSSGIIVTQKSGSNSFVSMRAAGVLFEPVPEPASCILIAGALTFLVAVRRR
jgi:hypothetical protein